MIGSIARRFDVDEETLMQVNGLVDPRALRTGTTLQIPNGDSSLETGASTMVTPTVEVPDRVFLEMNHTYQRMNNCAPAATSIALSTFGIYKSQMEIAAIQKPNPADVNVTAEEVAVSIREMGLEAYVGYNGTIDLVQRLVAAGLPVITEEWMPYDGGMGHFRVIRGYDRSHEQIIYNDSFYGPNRWRTYDTMLAAWKPYNNKFVVPYRPDQESMVREIIGASWDRDRAIEDLRATAQAQVEANPQDAYAWWGLGLARLRQGNPEHAIQAFERALEIGLPWRYLWYRYGYFEALNHAGQHEKVLSVTERTLWQMGPGEDLRYQRAIALVALGRVADAKLELQRALQDNPRFAPASHMLARLEEP